jgi:hypothetical protein
MPRQKTRDPSASSCQDHRREVAKKSSTETETTSAPNKSEPERRYQAAPSQKKSRDSLRQVFEHDSIASD